jgi:hypothetical protein
MQFYPECSATMADIELRMKTMDDEWSVSGEVGTEACVVNVVFPAETESDEEEEMDMDACELCGEINEDNVVHSWGCVKLCDKCAVNDDGTPRCPKGEVDECEHCYPESDDDEEDEFFLVGGEDDGLGPMVMGETRATCTTCRKVFRGDDNTIPELLRTGISLCPACVANN